MKRSVLAAQVLAAVIGVGVAYPAAAQLHVGQYAPEDVQHVVQLYSPRCTTCHGDGGNQVPGVSLLSGSFRRASTDEELTAIIRSGIAGTAMPQGNYSQAELTGLVAYLRTSATNR